jgi:dolichol kinase
MFKSTRPFGLLAVVWLSVAMPSLAYGNTFDKVSSLQSCDSSQLDRQACLVQTLHSCDHSRLEHQACLELQKSLNNINFEIVFVDTLAFVIKEFVRGFIFLVSANLLGLMVRCNSWNPNLTRKLLGIVLLVTMFATPTHYQKSYWALYNFASLALGLSYLLLLSAPVRRISPSCAMAFACLDRPEDRPYTLIYFMTSYAACTLIFLLFIYAGGGFGPYAVVAFYSIAIGDILAGLIGCHFGRLKYATRALFTTKTYTRSWEGSACVYVTSLVAVLLMRSSFPAAEFIPALLILPVALTLAEAKSPHTWDEPVMALTAFLVAMPIMLIW